MPRLAPTLYEFVELDNGDYLKVTEACMRIFDRQDWLRVNRARARIKVLIDKIGIDAFREHGRGGARGRLGRRARLLARRDPVRPRRGGERPRQAGGLRERPTATAASSTTSSSPTFSPSARRASRTVEVKVRRGDLTPDQLRGLGQIMRDYTGGYARTTVHQNLVLRWVRDESVYEVWQRPAASSSSATPAPTRSPTSSAAPAPTPASSGSPARWDSTRRSRSGSCRCRSTTS